MKSNLILFSIVLFSILSVAACKAKKEINDPTVLEINILAELDAGVPGNKIQEDLSNFNITAIKATNKTLNQYLYQVILKGQSANEVLRAFNTKPYVKSAIIAPTGDAPAENMPSGTSTRTTPIKGK